MRTPQSLFATLSSLLLWAPAAAQSPLELATKKLAQLGEIEKGATPEATATRRRVLLGEARDLCAKVAGAADAQAICVLRYNLANRAIEFQEWGVGADLARESLRFAAKTFPEHAYRWAIQESLAACLTERATGDKSKDVAEAESLLRPVVAYYGKRVEAALQLAGTDPVHEFDALARTRTLLGTAIGQGKNRKDEAAREIGGLLELLIKHGDRLPDPIVLRDAVASYEDYVLPNEKVRSFRAVLTVLEKHFPTHRNLQAFCRGELAISTLNRGDAKHAVAEARKVLALVRNGDVDVRRDGWTISQAAKALFMSGVSTEALTALNWLIEQYREAGVPPRDEEYVSALTSQISCLTKLERYEEALVLSRALIQFVRKEYHERHEHTFDIGVEHALLLQTIGNQKEARDLIDQIVTDGDRLLTREQPAFVANHGVRGEILYRQGRHEEALVEIDAMLEVDPTHRELRSIRGRILRSLGDPDAALAEFRGVRERIVATVERQEDTQVDDYWRQMLGFEATTLRLMGDYAAALTTAEERLRITRLWLPGESLSLAGALHDTGLCRKSAGDFRGAIQLFEEAVVIYEDQIGVDSLKLQDTRNQLAWCRLWLGNHSVAETLARAAIESLRRTKRTGLVIYSAAIRTLGEALARQEKWQEARESLESAITTAAKFGHRNTERYCRAALAAVVHGEGEADAAAKILREAIAVESERDYPDPHLLPHWRRQLLTILAVAANDEVRNELRSVLVSAQRRLDRLWSLSLRARSEAVTVLRRDAQLAAAIRRGHPDAIPAADLFEWLATLRAASGPLETRSWRGAGPEVRKLHDDLLRARRRVATLAHVQDSDLEAATAAKHRSRFRHASENRDAIERKLNKVVPAKSRFAWITARQIAVQLATNKAIAIAIHRVGAVLPFQKQDHYVAFIVDQNQGVRIIPLGNTSFIDTAIDTWRRWASGGSRGRAATTNTENPGVTLRKLVIDRIMKDVAHGQVFMTLDGALNTVAWDALPAADGKRRFVGDDYHIAILPSFRSLLEEGSRRRARSPKLLVMGDIDFKAKGAAPTKRAKATGPIGRGGSTGPWMPLPGSSDEIRVIRALFEQQHKNRKADILKQGAATKAALFDRRVAEFTHLHISTHGYFADPREGTKDDTHDVLIDLAPMTLCGLVLAGANNEPGPLEERVGIATAEELVGLDLAKCELAVLSGCQTNLGVRRAGQGLASLQAALHAAGARTAVTSLWRVPDEATSILMQKFYYHMWVDGLAPDRALWKARKSLAKQHPMKWAGWVFSGVPVRGR